MTLPFRIVLIILGLLGGVFMLVVHQYIWAAISFAVPVLVIAITVYSILNTKP